jgi:phosphatidate cytidylyltransferase
MTRILSALILIIVFAIPAVFGPAWAFFIVALIVIPLCMFELYRVAISPEARVLGWIALCASVPFLIFIYQGNLQASYFTLCLAAVAVILAALFLFEKGKACSKDIAYAIAGLIYPLALTSFWVLLRNGTDGRFWLIFAVVGVFGSDVGAYYTGKNLGKHRIAPKLSPKKTVEGFIGGICLSIVLGQIAYLIYPKIVPLDGSYPVALLAFLSACIGILDLAGDLTASLFKRDFNVKDMGKIIPGHGGMLDRMDGIILVGCLLYLVLKVAV